MLDRPTKHLTYSFPLDTLTLKSTRTGGEVEVELIQLTRWLAYWRVNSSWWRFPGPFVSGCPDPEDSHWRWGSYLRRLRKNPWVRCAAIRTSDGFIQGAIIYRRDGASLLAPNTGTVYVEYLSAAPCNRRDYAARPLYRGVGEALLRLAIAHSYDWGLGGRVALFSLPNAFPFYKKYNFVETGEREGRMIHYELTPDRAVDLLRNEGLL